MEGIDHDVEEHYVVRVNGDGYITAQVYELNLNRPRTRLIEEFDLSLKAQTQIYEFHRRVMPFLCAIADSPVP